MASDKQAASQWTQYRIVPAHRKYANSATSTVEHNRSRKLHVCGYLSSAVRHEPLVSRCLDTLSAGGGGDAGDVAASGVVSAVRLLVMCGS